MKCNIDELAELNTDKNYFGGNFFTEQLLIPHPSPSQERKPIGLLTPPPAKGEAGRGY
jgi:hypothetical protein